MTRARDIADFGSVSARLDTVGGSEGALSNRNVIINGAMQVAQRGTSSTGLGTSDGYFTVDRYKLFFGGSTAGRVTMTQDSSAPNGFSNSLKLACTTADTSIAAGEYFFIRQSIEGQDLQRFAKGTSDAKEFTVSFYVKGNASATYVVELEDADNTRQCSKTFNVTTDWTRVELTFPADTTGTFDDDNAASLHLHIWLHTGSTYGGGTLNSSAFASNTNANRAAGADSFFDSTSRTFFITGVQLEVGDTATDFEHRSYGDELTRCHRYFIRRNSPQDGYPGLIAGFHSTSGFFNGVTQFEVEMRTTPSLTTSGAFRGQGQTDSSSATGTCTIQNASSEACRLNCSSMSFSGTAGQYVHLQQTGGAGHVSFDAEL
jgi:hypothetical protein